MSQDKILLSDQINYINVSVESDVMYVLTGSVFFSNKEFNRNILFVVKFDNLILSKEECLLSGLCYSKNYGAYLYICEDIKNLFSISFLTPKNIKSMRIGFKKWYNQEDVSVSRELLLVNKYEKKVINLDQLSYTEKHNTDYLVLTTRYPKDDDYYRNHFIHARVREYVNQNNSVNVFGLASDKSHLEYYQFENIYVSMGSSQDLDRLISFNNYKNILIHFFNERMWNIVKKHIDNIKVTVWIHGYEVQPWYRRIFNYETEESLEKAKSDSIKRMNFWKKLFHNLHPNLHFIFVSQYFANEVMEDLGIKLNQKTYSIIHNYINTNIFTYETKDPEQRKKILSIRPYASRKYANDLSVEAVLYIAEKYPDIFSKLEFRFIGDGILFDETLKPIEVFSNVKIEKRFLEQSEIATLHKDYGLFLVPTRMDSQGVSKDEAMASGLVPITTNIAAIPEFVDKTCAILAEPEDYKGLAEGIIQLYKDEQLFLEMSYNASQRVRKQTNYQQTIAKELKLIKT